MLDWMANARDIAQRILAALGEAAAPLVDAAQHEPLHEQLKVIHYPGSTATLQGVGAHTDSGYLALIVADGVRGLQLHDGVAFADVDVAAGNLIVLAGRALQAATNGATHAAVHRVVNPPSNERRISITTFLNPRFTDADYGA